MRVLLMALVAALLLPPAGAAAHAVLVESTPASGARLDKAPALVMVRFSEPVEAEFTPLLVQNAAGERIDAGNAKVNPIDPTVVTVGLPPLPPGFYAAIYRITSADGHPVSGSIGFTVGDAVAPSQPDQALPTVPLSAGLLRGLTLAVTVTLAGLVAFLVLVWLPLAGAPRPTQLGRLALVAGAAFVALALAELAHHAARASGDSLSGALLLRAITTRTGKLWLIRSSLALLVSALLPLTPRVQPTWGRWLFLVPGAALLATFSLQSHAAAAGDWAPILVDWAHLLALAPWAGGLVGFVRLSRTALQPLPQPAREAILGEAVPRFTRVAVIAVLALTATGLYGALLHVDTLSSLLQTAYGRALLTKLALFLPVLALGGYHMSRRGRGPFRRTIMIEAALVGAVFLAAGYLTQAIPARVESWTRLGPFEQQAVSQGLTIHLQVAPNRVGINRYAITLTRADGRPETTAGVTLRADMLAHSMGVQSLTAKETAPGVYAGDLVLGMNGDWRLEVAVLTAQGREVRHHFLVSVPPAIAP